jgi:glucose-6-phosphate 1-epimerase
LNLQPHLYKIYTDYCSKQVFGPPPPNHATSALPQHGLARSSLWEFLGKSSESSGSAAADDTVKLDFGLSSAMLTPDFRSKWPHEFGLVYSVTLSPEGLGTLLQVRNQGEQSFEFQVLLHTYFGIEVSFQFPSSSYPPLSKRDKWWLTDCLNE